MSMDASDSVIHILYRKKEKICNLKRSKVKECIRLSRKFFNFFITCHMIVQFQTMTRIHVYNNLYPSLRIQNLGLKS